jgi:hypothetical protein
MYKNDVDIKIMRTKSNGGTFKMRIDKKIEIESNPKRIFDIVTDGENTPRWNIALDEVIEKEEGEKFLLKSTIGDILIIDTETVENEHVTWHMDKSDMNSIGYIVEPKGNLTEVTLWTDFENKKLRKGYEKTADLVLKSLKNYVDFIEEGGDPEDFDKKQLMVSP